MKTAFDSQRGAWFGMDVKCSKLNRTSATTLTSYKPARGRSKSMRDIGKLALVIPVLREAGNLNEALTRVRVALASLPIEWEVIVVDDDSRDGTEGIVCALAREDPRVRLLVRSRERGLSGAILYGWQHTDANILGVMDADGQHPAETLPALIGSIVNGSDLAIASRYVNGGRFSWNPVRRLISTAAIMAARPLQPERRSVRDPLSGFFLVRRPCVESVDFKAAGFKLLLEILVRGRVGNVHEVPFVFGRRRVGRSKLSLRVAWDYVTLLARLYRVRFAGPRMQAASGD
jgi:dolichol-phosphate mannosyltransferase